MSGTRMGYVLGIVLVLAGVGVDLLTGGEGGWRVLRSSLIGAGAGVCTVIFLRRRRLRAGRPETPPADGSAGEVR